MFRKMDVVRFSEYSSNAPDISNPFAGGVASEEKFAEQWSKSKFKYS